MALVYSTDVGRVCPTCRQAKADCRCRLAAAGAAPSAADKAAAQVRVSRDSKGRGGKTVTVVRGLPLPADALADLGKRLRSACGAGGTCKDGVLEVQGDHVLRVIDVLQQEGFKPKKSGGP